MGTAQWKIYYILRQISRFAFTYFRFRATLLHFGGLFCFALLAAACSRSEKPQPEPLYAETAPPSVKEFRWSNGKLPKSLDPALAAAPPETDVARALYEGLTDTDAKTLETVPAIAVSWSAADDYKTWTFKLRRDAKWSNDERLTAADFVRSWKRLAAFGEKAAHFQLFGNIAGMQTPKADRAQPKPPTAIDFLTEKNSDKSFPPVLGQTRENTIGQPSANNPPVKLPPAAAENTAPVAPKPTQESDRKPAATETAQKFGVEAPDDFTLKISLVKPDKDFPALVAHPLFRPVYGDGAYFETGKLNNNLITSGAFRLSGVSADALTLGKSENFWNKNQIALEKVRFVPMESAEKALEAYRSGDIDAVTNIDFEPLALKLLTPFDDFRRTTHSALNFYEFNRERAPFSDKRVREALAIAVERERLTEDEMDNASSPALNFSPVENEKNARLQQDVKRAQNLLTEAGFPNGANFPEIRLVVNRNDLQQRIARAVAKMWKRNLNVETQIVIKDQADFEAAQKNRDFDVLRRGVVLPTSDEMVNMLALFAPTASNEAVESPEKTAAAPEDAANRDSQIAAPENSLAAKPSAEAAAPENKRDAVSSAEADAGSKPLEILTEEDAFTQMPAIPLYFPTSYSLVKSYVRGFEINTLDALSLKAVRIDDNWQPKRPKGES